LLIADKLPAILSKDVVGIVSQVGDGVTAFKVGDRVMSLASGTVADSSQSGLQEYALADVVNCAKTPDNISDEEAVGSFSTPQDQQVLIDGLRRLCRPTYLPRS